MIDINKIKNWLTETINAYKEDSCDDAITRWYVLDTDDKGNDLAIVCGWTDGFEDNGIRDWNKDGEYRLYMKWTLEQMHRIEDLQRWYRQKTDRLLEALENGKVKIESYWDDCRKLVKNVRSDNSLREWQIVFENMENIINNKYMD